MLMSNSLHQAGMAAVSEYLRDATKSANVREHHLCGAHGPVASLEKKLKRHYGMKHALCVCNATTGLLALSLALELKNAEFITTPFTYGATIASWLPFGNRPRFADIDGDTLTLNPEAARKFISSKTKCLLVVDTFGVPADMESFRTLADKYGLWYIADASQSFGATRDGIPSSSLADALVVSFTAGKPLFAGEGGAILTNNSSLYEKLIWTTQHPSRQRRELGLDLDNEFAINARISPLSAAWAAGTFDFYAKMIKRRQKRCFELIDALNDIGLTLRISFADSLLPTFFRVTAAWKDKAQPESLLQELRSHGFNRRAAPLPLRLLYRQPSFMAQYPRWARQGHFCKEAERQSRIRFSLEA